MDRRKFVKTVGAASASMAIPFSIRAGNNLKETLAGKRPNIILMMVDDMGFADIGCYGSEIATPNLNRLSENGIKFTEFYNCARCCPSRASLMTGLYPHQTGIGHMTNPEFDYGKPGYRGRMNQNCVTIAEALKPAGYHTFMTGKWHLGKKPGQYPINRGFEEYYGLNEGAGNYFRPGELMRNDQYIDPNDLPENYYTTDAFTDTAIEMIRDHQPDGKPFFLYLAFNAPHWPLHAKPDDIAKYENRYTQGWDALREERYEREKALGIINPKWRLSDRDSEAPAWEELSAGLKEKMARKMAVYAGMIDCVDQNIGKLMRSLEKMGIQDNTLILFLSDNGACWETGAFGFDFNPKYSMKKYKEISEIGTDKSFVSYGRSWSNAGNTPFRLHKHWVHEGGIATPLIAYWPKEIKEKGKMTGELGHIMDIMPTCLELAGAEYPKEFGGNQITALEGKSLLPVLEGKGREGHAIIGWEHEGNRGLRRKNWKLVSEYPHEWELYDLDEDRTEMSNLADRYPDQARELMDQYEAWAKRCWVEPWNPVNKYWPFVRELLTRDLKK